MNHKAKRFFLAIVFILITLTSCSSKVSEEQAKSAAVSFLKSNVMFSSQNKTVPAPQIYVASTKKEGENYIFDILVTSSIDGKIKSAKAIIVVDGDGKVIMFNNNKVLPLPN